jgi:TetR/AcrR family transcriptional repressor of mexJK operon
VIRVTADEQDSEQEGAALAVRRSRAGAPGGGAVRGGAMQGGAVRGAAGRGAAGRSGGAARRDGAEPPRFPAKRAAIAHAALTLFVRDGYERTSVDAIAAKAGVSKRTVYSHYADKEQLFLSVVEDTYNGIMDQVLGIAARKLAGRGDLEHRLRGFIRAIARETGRSPERAALVRLILTEAPHFPALTAQWEGRRSLTPLLAEALTGPGIAGLDIADPAQAADHLTALTFGQINNRSLFGLLQLSDDELGSIIDSGIAVFLRAYRA